MSLKILFAGDFVYSNNNEKREYNLSKEYKDLIKQHDIFCCNLEGPVSCTGEKVEKVGPNIKNDKHAVKKIIQAGCNLFCLANNHIFDYGKKGIEETVTFLNEQKIDYIGAGINREQVYHPYIVQVDDIKLGIINVAENGFGAAIGIEYGYAYIFNSNIRKIIEEYKQKTDYLIIVSHMGAEHWEIPLPEVRQTYRNFIDLGVDIVIGHHPHVPQGWEKYHKGMIFYSLGNLIFDKGKGPLCPESFSVSLELEKNKKYNYKIIPTVFVDDCLKINNHDYSNLMNIIIDEKQYNKLVDDKIMWAYNQYKTSYFKVVSYDKGNFKEKIKGFIKRNIYKRKFSDKWLYHNLNIETHLWICRRATRLLMEKKWEERNVNKK